MATRRGCESDFDSRALRSRASRRLHSSLLQSLLRAHLVLRDLLSNSSLRKTLTRRNPSSSPLFSLSPLPTVSRSWPTSPPTFHNLSERMLLAIFAHSVESTPIDPLHRTHSSSFASAQRIRKSACGGEGRTWRCVIQYVKSGLASAIKAVFLSPDSSDPAKDVLWASPSQAFNIAPPINKSNF